MGTYDTIGGTPRHDPAFDAPEFWQFRCTMRTAAKPHVCENCGGTIEPGQRYSELVGLLGDKFLAVKQHIGCPGWEDGWDQEHRDGEYWWERDFSPAEEF